MAHVLSGLVKKRAELGGEFESLKKQINRTKDQIHHIDQTILLFDPNYHPQSIKIRRKQRTNLWFKRGEATRLVLEALRSNANEWMTTPQVTDYALGVKNILNLEKSDRNEVSSSIYMALSRYKSKGLVKRSNGKGGNGEYSWLLV